MEKDPIFHKHNIHLLKKQVHGTLTHEGIKLMESGVSRLEKNENN